MNAVLDANILFAALIRQSDSRRLLVSDELCLHAPEFIFEEMEKYRDEILRKTGKSADEFAQVLAVMKRRIRLTPLSDLLPFLERADKISPDKKDVAYVALALKMRIPLWSNDKALKDKQNEVTVYNTKEIIETLDSQ